MWIKNFSNFLNSELLQEEALISYNFSFKEILLDMRDMRSKIATFLLSLDLKYLDFDYTNIQISTTKNDEILFTPSNRIKYKIVNEFFLDINLSQKVCALIDNKITWPTSPQDHWKAVAKFPAGTIGRIEELFYKVVEGSDVKFYKKSDFTVPPEGSSLFAYFVNDAGDFIFIEVGEQQQNLEPVPTVGPQPLKIGRFAQRILTKANQEGYSFDFTQKDIANFVDEFAARIDIVRKRGDYLKIVDGEEIRKYYLVDNYTQKVEGTLHNSCMKYPKCQDYLDVYVENPEVCKMLVLMSDTEPDKIEARALVWKLIDGRTFMDRIYYTKQSHVMLLKEYAIKNGWIYKNSDGNVESAPGKLADSQNLAVQLENYDFNFYPYLDTLYNYDRDEDIIHNNMGEWDRDFELTSTFGMGPFSEVSDCDVCAGSGELECSECEGSGWRTCDDCNGDGEVVCDSCDGAGCDECDDSGNVECGTCDEGNVICLYCDGDGETNCYECN